jgi:hypothetical protein
LLLNVGILGVRRVCRVIDVLTSKVPGLHMSVSVCGVGLGGGGGVGGC